jgi:bacillithiol biosynthesis deacetylase BshB1
MFLDILCLAPHPDDAELCCGGLLLKAKQAGKTVGIVDFTAGEMGTRGSVALREQEVAASSRLLTVDARENLKLRDGYLISEPGLLAAIVTVLRRYRPKWVLAPHWEDSHPDHEAVGKAALHAAFMAGVPKYEPRSAAGVASPDELPYRPQTVLHYNNRYMIDADAVLDISDVFEKKLELTACFSSQFGPGADGDSGPKTKLSHENFYDWLRGIHAFYGHKIGVRYGEPYCVKGPLKMDDLLRAV